jgi:hypothetical protein
MVCIDIRLRELLQELPPELYDWIFRLTFTIDNDFCKIVKFRKDDGKQQRTSLSLLHVSRSTRAMYAPIYYGNSVFVLGDAKTGQNWLRSIADDHKKYLQDVRCLQSQPPRTTPPGSLDVTLAAHAALLQPGHDINHELRRIHNWYHVRRFFELGPRGVITIFVSEEEILSWPRVSRDWWAV